MKLLIARFEISTWYLCISPSSGTRMMYTVAQFVEALHYMPEGRGFHSRWGL